MALRGDITDDGSAALPALDSSLGGQPERRRDVDEVMDIPSVFAAIAVMMIVKVGGYAACLAIVRPRYDSPPRSVLFAALLRAGLGTAGTAVIAGVTFLVGALAVASNMGIDGWWIGVPFAIAMQVVLRFAAWFVTLVAAFDPERRALSKDAGLAVGGVVVSFLLDVPVAVIAMADLFFLLRNTRFC